MTTVNISELITQKAAPLPTEVGEPISILTEAPIPVGVLRRKFTENIEFVIDYENSKFNDKVLITYLSNLNLKCRINLTDPDKALKLVEAYMRSPTLVALNDLLDVVVNILLAYTGKPCMLSFDPSDFIRDNLDIIHIWMKRIASLYLYAFWIDSSVDKAFFEKWPTDVDESLVGVNYVHLIRHPLFHLLIDEIPEEAWLYNPFFFQEYVFAGQNLYPYFAVPENPLYMAVIARHNLRSDDYERLIDFALERPSHVPPAS